MSLYNLHMHAPSGLDPSVVARLFERSQAGRWGLSVERFQAVLDASVAHAIAGGAAGNPGTDIERHLSSLHVEDMALAAACIDGHEPAWEHFVAEHRALLHRAADAIDSSGGGRDLADSVYAELFGLEIRDGKRQSLFRYFHGRSKLATWLRAVLAQRHIDRVRGTKRQDPLPDDGDSLAAPVRSTTPDPERERFTEAMRGALTATIAALAPRDRLRLGCYYAQDLKLAAIGRLLGEHEATVSRHLARTRREIRAAVEERLRAEHGMDAHAIEECFQSVTGDAGALDLDELLGTAPGRKKDASDRSER